ncbi:MAG: sensor histidine kinase, partial [Halioglobus sp.]|nr:sensor histidine kinase [Halioglobus sp.]
LRVFVEKLFPAIMPYCAVDPETIITVNEVKDDPITLEIGTSLAVIIYELAINALSHAYAEDSPANYLRVISRTEYSKETEKETFSITVRDSGEGIEEDAIETAPSGSGIALVQSLADHIGAQFSYSYSKGTMAKIALEVSDSRPVFA